MWENVGSKKSLDIFQEDNKAPKVVAYFNYFWGCVPVCRLSCENGPLKCFPWSLLCLHVCFCKTTSSSFLNKIYTFFYLKLCSWLCRLTFCMFFFLRSNLSFAMAKWALFLLNEQVVLLPTLPVYKQHDAVITNPLTNRDGYGNIPEDCSLCRLYGRGPNSRADIHFTAVYYDH